MKEREKGFSLVELLIVLAIIVIISLIAIPQIQRISASLKIDASGHSVASLLQQARLQAVHDNAPAYAQFSAAAVPNTAYVNNDGTSAYVTGNPDVAISSSVTFRDPGPVLRQQLDAYLGATGTPGGPNPQVGTPVGFNARGLPCVPGATPAVCLQKDGTGAIPVFEWFMTDANGNWEAVTVTAAGRIKAWRLSTQGPSSAASCGYAACWQ